jgi:hypothetical protein
MRRVTTYERLHRHILAWMKRHILRLALFGPPGVGKSYAYKNALGNRRYHLFGGRQSALHIYNTLHDAPHLPVVLDDISNLLRDPVFTDLLKGLLETGERLIHWGTTTNKLEGRRKSFVCTSPVLIVLNKLPRNDPDVEAILDRCDAIYLEPTKMETVARMREIFPESRDLIDLIAELPALPTLRTLVRARDWQKSEDLNVIEELLSECGVSFEISQLVEIMETFPEREWCARYVQRTGLTDRTYRRHKRFADQIIACRRFPGRCPNVRAEAPESVSADGPGAPNQAPRTDGRVPADGQDSPRAA